MVDPDPAQGADAAHPPGSQSSLRQLTLRRGVRAPKCRLKVALGPGGRPDGFWTLRRNYSEKPSMTSGKIRTFQGVLIVIFPDAVREHTESNYNKVISATLRL